MIPNAGCGDFEIGKEKVERNPITRSLQQSVMDPPGTEMAKIVEEVGPVA